MGDPKGMGEIEEAEDTDEVSTESTAVSGPLSSTVPTTSHLVSSASPPISTLAVPTNPCIGNNPYAAPERFYNINYRLDKNGVKQPSQGPLPLIQLMKREAGTRVIYWFNSRMKRTESSFRDVFYNHLVNLPNRLLAQIAQKASRQYGPKFVVQENDGHTRKQVKQSMNHFGAQWGYCIYPESIGEMALLERAVLLLPPAPIIELYLAYFFHDLYLYFPILDEAEFSADVFRIVGQLQGGQLPSRLERDDDYAVLATLLYLLRLCFVSIFSNLAEENAELLSVPRYTAMLAHPIAIDMVRVCEECIGKFNMLSLHRLSVLQAMIFSRYYDSFAPEMGGYFADTRSRVLASMLVQMAINMGLHRDPDSSLDSQTEREKNLKRKIWHVVWMQDILSAISFGVPLTIVQGMHDTELPRKGAPNVGDLAMEAEVIVLFARHQPFVKCATKLLSMVYTVGEPVALADICAAVSELEQGCLQTLDGRTFTDFVNNGGGMYRDPSAPKRIYSFLHSKLLLLLMYCYMYIHYHDLGNIELEFFYMRKFFALYMCELCEIPRLCFARNLKGREGELAGGLCFAFVVTPIMNSINAMACLLPGTMSVRLLVTLRAQQGKLEERRRARARSDGTANTTDAAGDAVLVERIQRLSELYHVASKVTTHIFETMRCVGQRYNFAWNTRKLYMYGFTLAGAQLERDITLPQITSAFITYSNEQVVLLKEIFEYYLRECKVVRLREFVVRDIVEAFSRVIETQGNGPGPAVELEPALINEVLLDNFWCQHYIYQDVQHVDLKNFIACIRKNQPAPKKEDPTTFTYGQQYGLLEFLPFTNNFGDFMNYSFPELFEDHFSFQYTYN